MPLKDLAWLNEARELSWLTELPEGSRNLDSCVEKGRKDDPIISDGKCRFVENQPALSHKPFQRTAYLTEMSVPGEIGALEN